VGTPVGFFFVGLPVDGGSAGALVEFNDEGDPLVGFNDIGDPLVGFNDEGDPLFGILNCNCELACPAVGLPVVGVCDGALLRFNAVGGHVGH